MKKPYNLLILTAIVVMTGCATTPQETTTEEKSTKSATYLNDYPTRDRVEYVLNCIAEHGGLNFINQYACGCKIDKIAGQLSFEEYDTAKAFTNLRSTPGESGAIFRNTKQAKDLRAKLKEAEQRAEKACFVK